MRKRVAWSPQYIAGFFDGGGCIGIYKASGSHGYGLHVQLGQNSCEQTKRLFNFLCSEYGGSYHKQRTLSGGLKLNWRIGGKNACTFLICVLPFLYFKARQSEVAIEWHKNRPEARRGWRGYIKHNSLTKKKNDRRAADKLKCLKLQTLKDKEVTWMPSTTKC